MQYSTVISLLRNARGIYDLDTIKGCSKGVASDIGGCYGECYAAKYARRYGYEFNKSILRNFIDINHITKIRENIFNINMPFIRIGVSGDPSENWEHTIKIINLVFGIKEIVVITKHWNEMSFALLKKISKFNVCFNTSISALDSPELIKHRLLQYSKIKDFCRSCLRIVTCNFNTQNLQGMYLNEVQNYLLLNDNIIDTVLRISNNNFYFKSGVIKADYYNFMSKNTLMSKHNNKVFTGYCVDCLELCGINFN